ncbi:hypothetical protein GCM10023324_70490 [Streptomyces youssoufiensis]
MTGSPRLICDIILFEYSLSARRNHGSRGSVFVTAPHGRCYKWGIEGGSLRMGATAALLGTAPRAYNPDGGKRVQQAWQRYSASQQPWGAAAQQCARRARVPLAVCR